MTMPFHFSKGYTERGAYMGRPDNVGDPDAPCKLHLERVRLYGDYDKGGAYWGGGPGTLPLYVAYGDDTEIKVTIFTRAAHRDAAKAMVRALKPKARFYR
jgi:hypothetical protein